MSPEVQAVSVVIVTFNNAPEIKSCLTGLTENSHSHPLHIHIVDNASQDETVAIIESYFAEKGNRIKFTITKNTANLGFTAALNQGLMQCSGTYILVLNPDAKLMKNSLAQLISIFDNSKKIGVAAPQLKYPDGRIQPSCRRFPHRRDLIFIITGLSFLFPKSRIFNAWKMGDFSHQQEKDVEQPQGACLLFPCYILKEVGMWSEDFPMFFSDVDWCHRVINSGYKIVFTPVAQVVHKKGASIYRNRTQMILSSHKSFIRYFKKYRPNFLLVNQFFALILWVTAFIRVLLYRASEMRLIKEKNAE